MCGLSGFFATTPQSAELLRGMNTLIRHRGPDDEGYVVFSGIDRPACVLTGNDTIPDCNASPLSYIPHKRMIDDERIMLGLGHRRLSIIDLSISGHQPMCSPDGRYWIVYNGEVFNYIELRDELEKEGYTFLSQTDTEVILTAWNCWGEACLNRFNGMFAFALYDTKQYTLFLVRDRFGVKPLYYWVSPKGLIAFASEIKQFTVLPGWTPRLNGQHAYDFLIWGVLDHDQETFFRGVFQLSPGGLIRIDLKSFLKTDQIRPHEPLPFQAWYDLKPRIFCGTMDEAADTFFNLFQDAIRLRLRSDVPVGSCLSGGLDSSSIVCVIDRILGTGHSRAIQKSFSACSHEKQFDEREYIDEVVKATALDAYYVYPSLDKLFPSLEDIIWHQDEPFGSTSIYAQWDVFDLASKQRMKVMLDGQGADESLAGYHMFFAVRQASLLKQFAFSSFFADIKATHRLHQYGILQLLKNIASLILPAWQRQLISSIFMMDDITPRWLNLDRLHARAKNPFSHKGEKPGNVLDLCLLQLKSMSLPMLLHWEDRNSMAHSVEARVPFLDYRLVEFTTGLPDEFKLKNGVTKRVLREAMRNILPEKIRNRRDKLGFVTPEQQWIKQQNPDQFRLELKEAIDHSQGVLADSALSVLDDMIADRRPFSFQVWRLICFAKWLHLFQISV